MIRPRLHVDLDLQVLPRPIVRTLFDSEHVSIQFAFGNGVSDDIAAVSASADLSPRAAKALDRLLRSVGL